MEPLCSGLHRTVSWNSHTYKPQLLSAFFQLLGGES